MLFPSLKHSIAPYYLQDKGQIIYCMTLQDLVLAYPTTHSTINFTLKAQ